MKCFWYVLWKFYHLKIKKIYWWIRTRIYYHPTRCGECGKLMFINDPEWCFDLMSAPNYEVIYFCKKCSKDKKKGEEK